MNDVYDTGADSTNPRKQNQWTHGTALPRATCGSLLGVAKVCTLLVLAFSFPAGVQSPSVLWCTAGFLSLGWIYSAPPLRLKERPIVDSIANGLLCWLLWASGYTFSGESHLFVQAAKSASNGRLVFLFAAGMHGLAAVEDAGADALAGLRTIATVHGTSLAIWFSTVCLWVSRLVALRSLLINISASSFLVVERSKIIDLATLSSVSTATILLFAPQIRSVLIRLAFAGAYMGSIAWVMMILLRIHQGHEVPRSW